VRFATAISKRAIRSGEHLRLMFVLEGETHLRQDMLGVFTQLEDQHEIQTALYRQLHQHHN
jgi:hypothetical protein